MNPPNRLKPAPAVEDIVQKISIKKHRVFAWSPTNISGIDPKVICDMLSIQADAKPVK